MAVLRQDINTRIEAQDTRKVQDVQVQDARFQQKQTTLVGDKSAWRSNLVESIAGTAMRVGGDLVKVAQENAYLEGQAKAGRIQSEDELQGNFLTKDWETAGYRDTMGKLAFADSEAKLVADMKELREKPPAEMEAYLARRREELTPLISSMSREARANAFSQLLMADRTALAKHTGEHRAFILDTATVGIRDSTLTAARSLNEMKRAVVDGKVREESYLTSVQQYAANIETNIWRNPMFKNEPGIKSKLTSEAIQNALMNDHTAVYEYFRDNAFLKEDGTKRSVFADMEEGEAIKLGKSYLEARQRGTALREAALITQKAQIDAAIAEGNYTGTFEELRTSLDRMVFAGVIDKEGTQSTQQKFFQMRSKLDNMDGVASAFIRGSTTDLLAYGKSPSEAGQVQDAIWAKAAQQGRPVPVIAQLGMLYKALDNGHTEVAGKMIGARVGTSLMQLSRPDAPLDKEHAEIINAFTKKYDTSNATQQTYMLGGMTEEQKSRFVLMREAMRNSPVDTALAQVIAIEERSNKLSKQERAALAQATDADILKEVKSYDSQGLVMSWKNAIFDKERGTLQPDEFAWGIFGNSTKVKKAVVDVQSELLYEANSIKVLNPDASASSIVQIAASRVAERTLKTEYGPLIIPRDTTISKFFNFKGSSAVPNEVIAEAISKKVKPAVSGNTVAFEVSMGAIAFQEYDKDGAKTTVKGVLDPASVGAAVEEINSARVKHASEVYGPGKTKKVGNASVTYNGENAAGVDPSLMMLFRGSLVKNEGVTDAQYNDKSGHVNARTGKVVQTVGVGVSDTNPHFPKPDADGKITQEQINTSFRRASSDAAVFGSRARDRVGLPESKSAFLFFSEFAYQGTGGKNRAFSRMSDAIAARDKETALAALEETMAYRLSQQTRKDHYRNLLINIFEGK